MTEAADAALAQAIESLIVPGLLIGHRLIAPGDELALWDAEAASIASRVMQARRASGAVRIVARELLSRLGLSPCALPKGPTGAPLWPAGITGSFAHDERVAVAAVGRAREVGAVGIDIEPAVLLPPEMLDVVVTPRERLTIHDDPYRGRLLFAAKEAVYKAVHPLDGEFLDYPDIEIDLAARRAVVRNGRVVRLRYAVSTHLIVLALA